MQLSVPVREASVVEMMVGSIKYCTVINGNGTTGGIWWNDHCQESVSCPSIIYSKSKGPTDQEHAIGAIPKSGLQLH